MLMSNMYTHTFSPSSFRPFSISAKFIFSTFLNTGTTKPWNS